MFEKIKGQNKAISLLKRAVESGKIANSYLFYGPAGVGKFTTALYFGMMINCSAAHDKRPCGYCSSCSKFRNFSHPDFLFTFPTPKLDISLDGEIKSAKILEEYKDYIKNKIETPWKKFYFSKNIEIRIDSIRMLEHRINLSPNEGTKKIYIVEYAEMLNEKTANAFLKTLEEPPHDTVIILTTSKLNALLPTIISRCQQIKFYPISQKLIEEELKNQRYLEDTEAKIFARIANGNMEKALVLAEEDSSEVRQNVLIFLQIVISQNDAKFIEFSANFKGSKNILQELISHLIIWISDIAYLQNYPENIINIDSLEMVKQLFMKNPKVENYAFEMIEFLENMQHKLARHVNAQLILIEIYNEFSKIFGGIH